MSTPEPGVHPRLAQSHVELHSASSYRQAIRIIDSGQLGAAIPPSHRSSFKGLLELALLHFHDLGFAEGLSGSQPWEAAWTALGNTEGAAMRRRLEGTLQRIAEDFRRQYRDSENRWKRAASPAEKQRVFQEMNEHRRSISKLQSVDKNALLYKIDTCCSESFQFGWERGAGVRAANERKQRLGLSPEPIVVEIKLFVDPNDTGEDFSDLHLSP